MCPREGSEDQFYFFFEIILILFLEDFFFFLRSALIFAIFCLYLISTVTTWEFNHAWIFEFFYVSSGDLTEVLVLVSKHFTK